MTDLGRLGRLEICRIVGILFMMFNRIRVCVSSLMVVAGLLLGASPVLAASIAIQGQATFANTGGKLHFSQYNSNVVLDSDTGHLSGYAWSDDTGWIAFGTQDNEQGPVQVNLQTGIFSGSAKVLATGTFIDFSQNSSQLILNTGTGQFSGHIFDPEMGWIEFGGTGNEVVLAAALPPAVSPTPTPASGIDLPTTGAAIGLMAVLGWALLGGGVLSRLFWAKK